MDYFQRMKRRLEGQEDGVPGYLGEKYRGRKFAEGIGVKVPDLYFRGPSSRLTSITFPRRFVIKPEYASTSIGVFLLEKIEPGLYKDLISDETWSIQRLGQYYSDMSKQKYDDSERGLVLVEELLENSDGTFPPPDVRAYMFQGECGFYLVEDHIAGQAAASYYNGDFTPMADVKSRFGVHEKASHLEKIVTRPVPDNADMLEAVAKRVSVAVPSSFCRVDMYDSSRGVMLGEITFYPGTFYYGNRKIMYGEEAQRLGELWRRAEQRLAGSVKGKPFPQ
ncbi:ATP-grasp fold amidoligase family protein [Corynebacterium sp. ED61]|uniref:ATP-grasp fold amidoligase family protein n=1 Tax=Corynebacterium sp. ED61 TaxID=2211360 RepID=UPI001883FCEA|nr:ATP-grasp fold amidoligase family protein [Corynebacterium sp. ED61]MBF0580790.1 hypothetical protein [Corynebacterium sp. ED61]